MRRQVTLRSESSSGARRGVGLWILVDRSHLVFWETQRRTACFWGIRQLPGHVPSLVQWHSWFRCSVKIIKGRKKMFWTKTRGLEKWLLLMQNVVCASRLNTLSSLCHQPLAWSLTLRAAGWASRMGTLALHGEWMRQLPAWRCARVWMGWGLGTQLDCNPRPWTQGKGYTHCMSFALRP